MAMACSVVQPSGSMLSTGPWWVEYSVRDNSVVEPSSLPTSMVISFETIACGWSSTR